MLASDRCVCTHIDVCRMSIHVSHVRLALYGFIGGNVSEIDKERENNMNKFSLHNTISLRWDSFSLALTLYNFIYSIY